jgi:hypothetical protein
MKRLPIACWLFAGFCWLPAGVYAKNCSGLPTQFTGNEFPKGNFLSNFDNNCYLIPFSTGIGTASQGDTNSIYNKLYFEQCPLNGPTACGLGASLPPFELIVLGEFPNSRYFSISLYDNHSAITQNLTDVNIVPLTSSDINPYQPGVAYVSGQRYGAAIHLGGTPGNLEAGCMMTGNNIESNWMDGTQRHPYMNWNLSPAFFGPPPYDKPNHIVDTPEHSNPNPAGVVMIRSYLDLTGTVRSVQPHMIVRDVASGCAYPAAYIMRTLQNVLTADSNTGNPWQDQKQVQNHNLYASWQPTDCWGNIPYSRIQWLREDEYVSGANPDAGYLLAYVPAGLPQTLASGGAVLRIRFRVPTTPPTPCVNGCARSGSEQMRYMSISFEVPGGATLASLPDSCPLNPVIPCTPLIQDANGYVTLIVGTGVTQPAWVTPANGYTWLDLSQVGNPNYLQLNEIILRHILQSSTFECATQFVPYKVDEATTQNGVISGLMGLYSPWIDYPPAASLPPAASPLTCPPGQTCRNTCAVYPDGPPQVYTVSSPQCGVQLPPPVTITALTTQCANPSCTNLGYNQVVTQPSPPISILGTGFGSFPLGIPYSGNSNFVQIADTTQGWSAGYTGNPCTVTIGEWSGSAMSLVANVNQNGACPMAAGDQLTVTVWNPQTTVASPPFTATVVAQSGTARKP